jgi:hypothetical protein
MDYVQETLRFNHQINREFNDVVLEQMDYESDFILTVLEHMEVVTEASKMGEKMKAIFQKVIDFLKKIFGLFTKKVKEIVDRDKQWLSQNKQALSQADYDGLEISMTPYWTQSMNESQSVLNTLTDLDVNSSRLKTWTDVNKSTEEYRKKHMSKFIDENGELASGLKNVFRVGKSQGPIKPVVIAENALKTQINNEFHKYCVGYQSNVVRIAQQKTNDIERRLKTIIQEIERRDRQSVAESYVMVEDATYAETEVALCENFSVLMEAEQPASGSDKDKQSPSKVTLTDEKKEEAKKNGESTSNADKGDAQLRFEKMLAGNAQMAVSAFLTVSEEKYSAYMNAMRQVVSARKPKKEKDEE